MYTRISKNTETERTVTVGDYGFVVARLTLRPTFDGRFEATVDRPNSCRRPQVGIFHNVEVAAYWLCQMVGIEPDLYRCVNGDDEEASA